MSTKIVRKETHYPLVLVEWHDANARAHWHTPDDLEDWMLDDSFRCKNVGWLIKKTEESILLASRVSGVSAEYDQQYGLLEKLPRKMIDKITVLKK